jgi:hypothetical protein
MCDRVSAVAIDRYVEFPERSCLGSDPISALSRCRAANAKRRCPSNCQAAATTVRHVVIATARNARCVWAETRWRWTLKVL